MKRKMFVYILLPVICLIYLVGCDLQNNSITYSTSTTYFDKLSAKVSENSSTVQGTIQLNDIPADFLFVEMNEDISAVLDYSFIRNKGNVEVYYQSPDGTDTLIMDTSEEEQDFMKGSCTIFLKQGLGIFYVTGSKGIFDFKLKMNVNEDKIQYFSINSPEARAEEERQHSSSVLHGPR